MADVFKPGEKGFSHYRHVWDNLGSGNRYHFSEEPAIIVAMNTSGYLNAMPHLLEIEGLDFEAKKEVYFTDKEVKEIRKAINKLYAEKMNVPARNFLGTQPDVALGLSDLYDTKEFNPKRLKVHRLLDSDIKVFYPANDKESIALLIIENFSNPDDDRRFDEDHHYVAAVADVNHSYNWSDDTVRNVTPKLEKIIEILTNEEQ